MRQKAVALRFRPGPFKDPGNPDPQDGGHPAKRPRKDPGESQTRISLPQFSVSYPEAIETGISRILPFLPEAPISKRSLALMLLSGDESLTQWLHQNLSEETILQIEKIRQEIQNHFAEPIGSLINQTRLRKVDEILSEVMSTPRGTLQEPLRFDRKSFDPSLLGDPHPSPRSVRHV